MKLTPEQIAAYKSQGWTVLPYPFGISYKSHWNTPWYFIREFYQNALDEHDEANVPMPPEIRQTTEGAVIEDKGRGLGAEALLMSETKEAGDLRGRFGEGMKFACLAAVRQGYTPVIESAHTIIEAHSMQQKLGRADTEILVFLYKAAQQHRIGTKVTIKGYRSELYTDRFTPFLGKAYAGENKQLGRFQRRDSVYTNPPGRLYVGDIFIKKLENSQFSYNLWGLKLNPDRVSEISHMDLMGAMSYPWKGITTEDQAIKLLQAMTKVGSDESQIGWNYYPPENLMKAAWRRLYGKAVLYTGDIEKRLAEGYGYIVRGEGWSYQTLRVLASLEIPTDREMVDTRIEELSSPKPIPDNKLNSEQRMNLELLRFLARNNPDTEKAEIQAAILPNDPRTENIVTGLCSDKVYLALSVLSNQEDALAVGYHELGHFVSDARDGSIDHTKAVQKVAAQLSILIHQRVADVNRILGIKETEGVVPVGSMSPGLSGPYVWVMVGTKKTQFANPSLAGQYIKQLQHGRISTPDWLGPREVEIWELAYEVYWGDKTGKPVRDFTQMEKNIFKFGLGVR